MPKSFQKILLFGAGGTTIGHHILQALVEDGTFHVTVLARESSKTTYPSSVGIFRINEAFSHADLVRALSGQDVVISATGLQAHLQEYKLIDAAVEAGVKRFIPSEWGKDNSDPKSQDLFELFRGKGEIEVYLQSKESSTFSWTAVATGLWLDWALSHAFLDIDPRGHTAQYWHDGSYCFSTAPFPYCARATIQILKHPEVATNKRIFLSPFETSQRQIVAELEYQQGVKYHVSNVDSETVVHEAKANWDAHRNESAAYTLVLAGILYPEYNANFVSSGKQPILEQSLEMPKLTLRDVLQAWLGSHA